MAKTHCSPLFLCRACPKDRVNVRKSLDVFVVISPRILKTREEILDHMKKQHEVEKVGDEHRME